MTTWNELWVHFSKLFPQCNKDGIQKHSIDEFVDKKGDHIDCDKWNKQQEAPINYQH